MQNYTGWTVGSKTVKLRGLNAKNRTRMQLLLNCRGLRVDFQELQGLFSKNGTLTGTFGQRSSDRDLAVEI